MSINDEVQAKYKKLLDSKEGHPNISDMKNAIELINMKSDRWAASQDILKKLYLNNKIPIWKDGSCAIPDGIMLNDGTAKVKLIWSNESNNEDGLTTLSVAPYNVQQEAPGKDITVVTGVMILKSDASTLRIMNADFILRENFEKYAEYPNADEAIYQKIKNFYCDFYKIKDWTDTTRNTTESISKNFLIQEKFIKAIGDTFKIDTSKTDIINYITSHCIADPQDLFNFFFETYEEQFPEIL